MSALREDSVSECLRLGQARYPGVQVSPGAFRDTLERIAPGETVKGLVVEDIFLVAGCVEGSSTALATLDEILERLCRVATRDLDGAELCQRVRMSLLVSESGGAGKLSQYAGRGALVKWLSAVVQRTALNLARERKAAEPESGLIERPAPGADPEQALMRERDGALFKRAFQAALRELPERARTLLRMYYLEGFTADQIAQIHQAHRVSVARWLAEAKRNLRAATRSQLVQEAVSPSSVDQLMRVSNVHFGASLEHACR